MKAVEAEEKEEARREREAEKQREREERERNRPVYSFNFMVAGVPYEGRSAVVAKYAAEGTPSTWRRDFPSRATRRVAYSNHPAATTRTLTPRVPTHALLLRLTSDSTL